MSHLDATGCPAFDTFGNIGNASRELLIARCGNDMAPKSWSYLCLLLVLMTDYYTDRAQVRPDQQEAPHVWAVMSDVYPIARSYRREINQQIITPVQVLSGLLSIDSLDAEEPAYALVEVHAPTPAGHDLLSALMSYQC